MNASTTAFKYRPEARITGRSLDSIARKVARNVRSGWSVRKLSETVDRPFPTGGTFLDQATYILVDDHGEDVADTIFAVTEDRSIA